MANTGSNTVRKNTRRIEGALRIDHEQAFRLLVEAKTADLTWTAAADQIIARHQEEQA